MTKTTKKNDTKSVQNHVKEVLYIVTIGVIIFFNNNDNNNIIICVDMRNNIFVK